MSRQARDAPIGAVLSSQLKGQVEGLAFLRTERHFLVLLAQLFVHEGHSVLARREAFNFELAVRSGDRIERALGYVNEHPHPRMLIALYGQHNFFAREAFLQGRSLRSLRLIPFAIVLWRGVNVVCCRIAILDLHALPCHHAEHVGMIFTSALIQYDGILWKGKSAVAQSLFHIHEDVCQVTASYHKVFCCVRSFAVSILAHVNLRRLRSYTSNFTVPLMVAALAGSIGVAPGAAAG